jgi:uncharacterized RDD family membrane protein YckC
MNTRWKKFFLSLALLIDLGLLLFSCILIYLLQFDDEFKKKVGDAETRDLILPVYYAIAFIFFSIVIALIRYLFKDKNSAKNENRKIANRNLATYSSRFYAALIDTVPFICVSLLSYKIQSWNTWNFSFFYLLEFLYFSYELFLSAYYGQTVGKMMLKIKIFKMDGSDIGMRESFLRLIPNLIPLLMTLFAYLYSFNQLSDSFFQSSDFSELTMKFEKLNPYSKYTIILTYFVGSLELVTMFLNRERRAVHDLIAGTIVLEKEPKS